MMVMTHQVLMDSVVSVASSDMEERGNIRDLCSDLRIRIDTNRGRDPKRV